MTILNRNGRWKGNNLRSIIQGLAVGYRNPKPKRVKSVITFRGTTEDWLKLQKGGN